MPIIGFTLFRDKIIKGEKTQTIRRPRKRKIKVGDTLYLWWKPRTKDAEFIGETVCIEVIETSLAEIWDDEDLAIKDGFNNLEEFRKFFSRYKKDDVKPEDIKLTIIRWEYPFKSERKYHQLTLDVVT